MISPQKLTVCFGVLNHINSIECGIGMPGCDYSREKNGRALTHNENLTKDAALTTIREYLNSQEPEVQPRYHLPVAATEQTPPTAGPTPGQTDQPMPRPVVDPSENSWESHELQNTPPNAT